MQTETSMYSFFLNKLSREYNIQVHHIDDILSMRLKEEKCSKSKVTFRNLEDIWYRDCELEVLSAINEYGFAA